MPGSVRSEHEIKRKDFGVLIVDLMQVTSPSSSWIRRRRSRIFLRFQQLCLNVLYHPLESMKKKIFQELETDPPKATRDNA